MTEQKTASGVCTEVSERGDWTTFHVDIGTQWPIKLTTKKAEMIELGRAAQKAGGEFEWTYTETQGNPNPHAPGTFYTNRYLEAVAPRDGTSENHQNATPAAQPPSRDERAQSEVVRQRLITRQTCIKAAAEMLRLSDGTLDEQITAALKVAKAFETWLYRDIDPEPFA